MNMDEEGDKPGKEAATDFADEKACDPQIAQIAQIAQIHTD
jgi:hypothetical protein